MEKKPRQLDMRRGASGSGAGRDLGGGGLAGPRRGRSAHLVPGAADDRGEDGAGGIVSREACLDQARAIVAHEGGGLLVVTHPGEEAGSCKTQRAARLLIAGAGGSSA